MTALGQSSYFNLSLFDGSEFTVSLDNGTVLSAGNYAEYPSIQAGEHDLSVMKNNSSDIIFKGKFKIPITTCMYTVIDEYGALMVYRKFSTSGDCSSDATLPGWKKCGSSSTDVNIKPKDTTKIDNACLNKMREDDYVSDFIIYKPLNRLPAFVVYLTKMR